MKRSRVNLQPIARTLALAALAGTASCATAAKLFLPAPSSGGSVTSVYVAGPVPGWERSLRASPSAATSPYFTARLFGGRCPTFNISSAAHDPFGPIERPPSEPFSLDNSLGIDGHYVPFGHVRLGGPGAIASGWETLSMYGMAGGGCDFPGLGLLSFGSSRASDAAIHR